jgi:hypothetical protein
MISLIGLLFAISPSNLQYIDMSCNDAYALIDRVYEYQQQSDCITNDDANEIVEVVKESVPSVPECFNEGSK